MDNRVLVIAYKYINRIFNAKVLIEKLEDVDLSVYDDQSKIEIKQLIKDVKEIEKNTLNTVDEYVTKEKERLKSIIELFEKVANNQKNSQELKDEATKRIEQFKVDYEKEIDSYERWLKIATYFWNNEYLKRSFDSLSKYELLMFITQFISSPNPIELTQEEFDELTDIGIEHDEREMLWRLAFNYEYKDKNFDKIVDYFIKVEDAYYLAELISAVGKCLNIDRLIDSLDNKKFIKELLTYEYIKDNMEEEQYKKLQNK